MFQLRGQSRKRFIGPNIRLSIVDCRPCDGRTNLFFDQAARVIASLPSLVEAHARVSTQRKGIFGATKAKTKPPQLRAGRGYEQAQASAVRPLVWPLVRPFAWHGSAGLP